MVVMIAAGGTGGHINPGIAIANKIKNVNPNATIIFVGTKHGLENELVVRSGYKLEHIRASGIKRQITIKNVRNFCNVFLGLVDSKKLIKKYKPDIVIGTGGYVTGPFLKVATKQKVYTILHESNALAGITVKLLAKKVDKVLLGFEDAKKKLPNLDSISVVGNPTKVCKINLTNKDREEYVKKIGLDFNKPIVIVTGGSQGAQKINDVIVKIISENEKNINTNYQILFATGIKQFDNIKVKFKNLGIDIDKLCFAQIVPYIYDMEKAMNVSSILIGRAGALTVTEVCLVGIASILIPLPTAAENHQEYNARVLVNNNAGKMILEKDLNDTLLKETILDLLSDTEKLKQTGANVHKLAKTSVEDRIYEYIKEFIEKDKKG